MLERMTLVYRDESYKTKERKNKLLNNNLNINLNALKVIIAAFSKVYQKMMAFGK